MKKGPKRALMAAMAILLGLPVLLVALLHLPSTLSYARDAAVDATNEALRGELAIGHVSGSVFSELTIHDVELRAPGGEAVARVDELRASVSLPALLARGVVLDVDVRGIAVFLRRSADGSLNLLEALPAPTEEPSTGLPVWLDFDLRIADGTIVWRDDGAHAPADDPLDVLTATYGKSDISRLLDAVKRPEAPPRTAPRTAALADLSTQLRVEVSMSGDVDLHVAELGAVFGSAGVTEKRAMSLGNVHLAVPASGGATSIALQELEVRDWLTLSRARLAVPQDLANLAADVRGLQATRAFLGAVAPEAALSTDVRLQAAIAPNAAGASVFDLTIKPGDFEEVRIAGELEGWLAPGPQTRWALSVSAPSFAAAEISAATWPIAKMSAYADIEGSGVDPETVQARARVGVRAATIDRYRIENAYLDAKVDAGAAEIVELLVQTPYASVAASGDAGLDGRFDLRARARASDEMAQLVASLFQKKLETRADVDIVARGRVDFAAADPLAMMQELDAGIDWDVREFTAEDVHVRASTGHLEAKVQTSEGSTRVRLDGRVRAQGALADGVRLGALSIDVQADSRLQAEGPDVMRVLRRMTARLDVDVDEFSAGDARARDLRVLARVGPQGDHQRYEVTASGRGVAAGNARVSDAAIQLDGDVTLGDVAAWPGALRALRARGTAAARGLSLGTDAVTAVDATIDVQGPVGDLRGKIGARTDGLVLGQYAFESLSAVIEFIGDRHFVVDAEGVQKDRKPADVGVHVRGRYNRELTDFEVLELRFKSLSDDWSLTDGFSIDTKTGTIRFDDVTLTHGAQRVWVKGTYRQGKDQDIAAEIVGLELATVVADFGVAALQPLRGNLTATAQVGGTSREPTARFDIHLRDLYWEELGPFEVRAVGTYGDRALVVEKLSVDGWGVRLVQGEATLPVRIETTGVFEVLQSEPVSAAIETPKLELGRLHHALEALAAWDVVGGVSLDLRLRGTLLNPAFNANVRTDAVRARVDLEGDRFDVGPVTSTIAVRFDDPGNENGGFEVGVNAQWADQAPMQMLARIRADVAAWLRESLDGKEVDWSARMVAAPWRFVGQASRFDLRKLRVGALRKADVEGFLSLQIIGDGSLAAPRANFEFELAEFGWDRYRDVFVDANLAVEPERIVLKSSRLEWDAAEIATASGAIPVPFRALFGDAPWQDLPIDFRVDLTRTPLSKLSAVDYAFASLRGTVGGFVSFGGTLEAPTVGLSVSAQDVEFIDGSTGGVAVDLALSRDDRLDGSVVWARSGTPTLTAKLGAPLDVNIPRLIAGEPLDLSGEFSAELTGEAVPLGALVPRRIFDDLFKDLAGRLDAALTIGGTLEQPSLEGRLVIDDGVITLPRVGRTFRDVALDLSARRAEGITLRRLHVSAERGTVDASGALALAGWRPGVVDARAEVRDFGTMGFTDEAMFVTADVDLGGDFSSHPATATATVSAVEVVVPSASDMRAHPTGLDKDIVIVRTNAERDALYAVEGVVEPVSTAPYLELAVKIEPGARVRHPLAQVEAQGDLRMALSDSGPVLYGEVQTTRGSAQFLGKKFQIAEAIVSFTGQDPPDPRLQIEAVYTLDRSITRSIGQPTSGDPRAIARITGRLSDPRIRFLSDPAMPESDVLYVLLTNRAPDRGEVGETGLATGAASGLLTGLIADSPVGQVFDVRFEAGEQGFSDASIEVGRHIGPDVFVSVDFIGGAQPNENSSELNIEYRFLPRWIFEFKAGNRATGEANIFWDIY